MRLNNIIEQSGTPWQRGDVFTHTNVDVIKAFFVIVESRAFMSFTRHTRHLEVVGYLPITMQL